MADIPFDTFNDAPFMFHSIDKNGVIINVSKEWLKVLGYSRDEVIGRPSTDFLTKEAKIYAEKTILPKFYKTGQCKNVHYQFVKKDGSIADVLMSATAQMDEKGKFLNSLAFLTDVTNQKLVEDLIEAKEMYQTLSRVSPVGIIRINEKNKCVYVNRTWQEFAGMNNDDAKGEGWKKAIHPDDRYRVVREWNKCARESEDFCFEYRMVSADKEITWVLAQANLVNAGGKGYVGTVTDITSSKEILPQILEIRNSVKCSDRRGQKYGSIHRS